MLADRWEAGERNALWSRPLKGVSSSWSSCWPGPSPPTALHGRRAPLPRPHTALARGDSGGTCRSWGATPRGSGGTISEETQGGRSQHKAGGPVPSSGRGSGASPQAEGSCCGSLRPGTGRSWCLWLAGCSSCGQGSLSLISDEALTPPPGPLVTPEWITGRVLLPRVYFHFLLCCHF